jgi:transcriptional regulator with XRE-family HTH domain
MSMPGGELGPRLREARLLAGLRVAQVAEALGCLPITVYRWEVGRTKPSIELCIAIADLTKVDIRWLVSGRGKPRRRTA